MCMLKHNRAVFGRMDVCFKCFLCFSLVSKNDTDVSYYNFDADQPILIIFLRVLLREYAIKRWFVIPPLLANVSALPMGKHEPRKLCLSSHAAYRHRVCKTKWLGDK